MHFKKNKCLAFQGWTFLLQLHTVQMWRSFCFCKQGEACQLPVDAICWSQLQKLGPFLICLFCLLWKMESYTVHWGAGGLNRLFPCIFLQKSWGTCFLLCSEYCKFQGMESSLWSQISLVQSISLLHLCCRALLPSFPWFLPFTSFSSRLRVILN